MAPAERLGSSHVKAFEVHAALRGRPINAAIGLNSQPSLPGPAHNPHLLQALGVWTARPKDELQLGPQ
eukprot:4759455-Alexandrium_andersonii.AAC.1